MSKLDAQRAMREANYAARNKGQDHHQREVSGTAGDTRGPARSLVGLPRPAPAHRAAPAPSDVRAQVDERPRLHPRRRALGEVATATAERSLVVEERPEAPGVEETPVVEERGTSVSKPQRSETPGRRVFKNRLAPVRHAAYELQARPHLVDRAHLDVDDPRGQTDLTYRYVINSSSKRSEWAIFSYRGPLRPAHPDRPGLLGPLDQLRQPLLERLSWRGR